MKKLILTLSFIIFGTYSYAQTSFDSAMKAPVEQMKTAKTIQELDGLFATFSQLTTKESPNRWKAYYYAGLAQYKKAELILSSGNTGGAAEANALAYKFVAGGVPSTNAEGKKLLDQIIIQRKNFK